MFNQKYSDNKNLQEKVLEKIEEENTFIDQEKIEEFNKKLELIFA